MALIAHWERTGARSFDIREEAARIRCPTLVLAGEDDPATAITGADELVREFLAPEPA